MTPADEWEALQIFMLLKSVTCQLGLNWECLMPQSDLGLMAPDLISHSLEVQKLHHCGVLWSYRHKKLEALCMWQQLLKALPEEAM